MFPSFKIFDHDFVSKHELLSSEEREKILSDYKMEPYQLPRIRASDPAVIAVGGTPGDIVKVIRKSPTAGKYIAYRYVV
ncbi:MAG: DNA-directed RNA polymerase subunit H [Candidatus Bathyarchaeota archaeon]